MRRIRVGFVGLGNIGLPMAKNIAEAGFALTVFDVNPEPSRQLAAKGARVAATLSEVARDSELIGICVRDDAQVEEVLLGQDGLLSAARPGTIVPIHSTIRPRTVLKLAEIAARRGVEVLDVAITGGSRGAEARTLCYMAGGDEKLVERCRDVFETSASKIVPTGALGSGMATKLCNNLILYLEFLAAFEATLLAEAAGISEEVLTSVTRANGVMTPFMEAYLDMRKRLRAGRRGDALDEQRERFADLAEKDLAVTLEFARDLGVSLPGTAACRQLMARVFGLEERRRTGAEGV